MSVFMCRWPNADCSFVVAETGTDAILLDEIDNAETAELIEVPDFMLHLQLTDNGEFRFPDFGLGR